MSLSNRRVNATHFLEKLSLLCDLYPTVYLNQCQNHRVIGFQRISKPNLYLFLKFAQIYSLKRFLKPMISHCKFRVLSLNENIVKSTLTEIFCAIVFALDLNPFKV